MQASRRPGGQSKEVGQSKSTCVFCWVWKIKPDTKALTPIFLLFQWAPDLSHSGLLHRPVHLLCLSGDVISLLYILHSVCYKWGSHIWLHEARKSLVGLSSLSSLGSWGTTLTRCTKPLGCTTFHARDWGWSREQGNPTSSPDRGFRLGKCDLGVHSSGHVWTHSLHGNHVGRLLKCRNSEPGTDLLNQYAQGLAISILKAVLHLQAQRRRRVTALHPHVILPYLPNDFKWVNDVQHSYIAQVCLKVC